MKTTIGFLRSGDIFLLDERTYKVGHIIKNTNSYVACVDITEDKKVVRRFYIDTEVVSIKEKK